MSSSPNEIAETGAVTVLGRAPLVGVRKLGASFVPYSAPIFRGFVVLLVTNVLALALPRLVNEGVDLVEGRAPASSILTGFGIASPGVVSIVVAIIVATILGAVFRVISRIILFNLGRDVERDLRQALFRHLSTLSPTFYRKNATGDLMSRMTNDLTNVRLMAGFALLNVMNAILIFVTTLPLLFLLDVKTAIAALIPYPLVMGVAQALSKTMFQRTKVGQETLGKLTSAIQENLAGQQVVRAFAQQDKEERRFAEVNQANFDAAMRLAAVRVVFFPLMGLMSALGVSIALYVGGEAVVAGRMSTGDIVEFNARLLQLTWPAIAMGFIVSVYQRGRASFDRINEIFKAAPDIVDGPYRGEVTGRIEAKDLVVRHPGEPGSTTKPPLDGLTFVVEPGRVLGVVGKNASGKSTLVKAILRLIPVERGQLWLDGHDANDWHLAALHSGVASVTDDGFLFSATLKENLTFARPDASDDEVTHAIDVADLSRDIAVFPEGLETLVGERGVTLSGGQRQRVALARALLARPRVLVLDDSLSAVDAETETRIVGALRAGRFSADGSAPTLVVISHRLSAVRAADEILVLDDGRVVERGRHDVLLQHAGLYAELWGTEQLKRRLAAAEGA
jgi:ATP-binding cassette subfamily B multidrug efflux pump